MSNVSIPGVTTAEATEILNQMEDLVNDYRILSQDFDMDGQEEVAGAFLRANPSFNNNEMQDFVDRANTLLDRVEGRHGRETNERNRRDQEELNRLTRLQIGGRRDLTVLRVQLQARFGGMGFGGQRQQGLGGQMRPRNDLTAASSPSQSMHTTPRNPSRTPLPSQRQYFRQSNFEVGEEEEEAPPSESKPRTIAPRIRSHTPQSSFGQAPNRPNPHRNRPMRPIPPLSPPNPAQEDIGRLRDENRGLRAENTELRAQLQRAREVVEESRARQDAWYESEEGALERERAKKRK